MGHFESALQKLREPRIRTQTIEFRDKTQPTPPMTGEANEIIMGFAGSGFDFPFQTPADFEFEQD